MNYDLLDRNEVLEAKIDKMAERIDADKTFDPVTAAKLANGDICVSIGYSADVLQARDRAAEAGRGINTAYSIPRDGAQFGCDMMVISDDAPNPESALTSPIAVRV